MKRSVSCCGAFPFDSHLDILLQKGSVFCVCRRACNLSAVRDFGVGSFASDTSGIISGCKVKVSDDRHSWVQFLVLNAGPSMSVTDNMLIDTGLSWGNSTRHERQSAALLHAPESVDLVIHIFSIKEYVEWLVIILHYDIGSLEIIIPLGNGIINSVSFLFSGAPFSLCFQKSMWEKGNTEFSTIMFLG